MYRIVTIRGFYAPVHIIFEYEGKRQYIPIYDRSVPYGSPSGEVVILAKLDENNILWVLDMKYILLKDTKNEIKNIK